jgi:DNA-binding response OmpR family regulator
MPHVLVTERHEAVNRLLCEVMIRAGYRCSGARSPAEAECVLAAGDVDLIVLEASYPDGGSDLELLELAHGCGVKAIVVTAHPVSLPEDVPVVRKPFAVGRLLAVARELVGDGVGSAAARG